MFREDYLVYRRWLRIGGNTFPGSQYGLNLPGEGLLQLCVR